MSRDQQVTYSAQESVSSMYILTLYKSNTDGSSGVKHWIDGHPTPLVSPMCGYPQYSQTWSSWGADVLGDVVVEVQSEDGTVGVGQPLPTDLNCREDHRFSRPSSVIDVAQSCQLLTSTHNNTVFQV